jgi:hypothetical protein
MLKSPYLFFDLMQISNVTAAVGLVLSLAGAGGGWLMWFRANVQKSYAAERDFQHLRRNQEQIVSSLNTMVRELDEQTRSLKDMVVAMNRLADESAANSRLMTEQRVMMNLLGGWLSDRAHSSPS